MELQFVFPCGLRGYHEYRLIWTPALHEVLTVKQERSNPYDRFAIVCTTRPPASISDTIVGHLPKEISHYTFFIINYGARVSVSVTDTHYRRSPLIQGGLEIPIQVTIKMDCSRSTHLNAYKSFVTKKYSEPVNGNFCDATTDILKKLRLEDDSSSSSDDEEEATPSVVN